MLNNRFNEDYTFVAYHNNQWVNGTWDISIVLSFPVQYIINLKFEPSTKLNEVPCYINYLVNDTLNLTTVEFNDVIAKYVKN